MHTEEEDTDLLSATVKTRPARVAVTKNLCSGTVCALHSATCVSLSRAYLVPINVMLVGTSNLYRFMLFSVTLTLPEVYKVIGRQNLMSIKFELVLKQFSLNTVTSPSSEKNLIMGNICCTTDCLKKSILKNFFF